jgi:hypothetical protein
LFRPPGPTKQFSPAKKPYSAFGAGIRKQRLVINLTTKTAGATPATKTGDSQMRTLSFILASAFVLAGPSLAGSSDNSLPGVGTFAYTGSSLAVPHALLVAAR